MDVSEILAVSDEEEPVPETEDGDLTSAVDDVEIVSGDEDKQADQEQFKDADVVGDGSGAISEERNDPKGKGKAREVEPARKMMESSDGFPTLVEAEPPRTQVASSSTSMASRTMPLLGQMDQVFFENLEPYTRLLNDPARSAISIDLAVANLQAAMNREAGSLNTISNLVASRQMIADAILPGLIEESRRLRAEETSRNAARGAETEAVTETNQAAQRTRSRGRK